MLHKLQKNWLIESLDFHVKGYWEIDSVGKIFDLRHLQSNPISEAKRGNVPYLTMRNNTNIIQFEPNAFYEIERVEESQLVMTYYVVMNAHLEEEPVRVFTIRLMMH